MQKISISVYLDSRKKNKTGTYPVKLRVYHNLQARLYPTGMKLSKADFERSYLTQKPRQEFKQIDTALRSIEMKANSTAEKLEVFTFEKFEAKMFRRTGDAVNVIHHFQMKIESMETDERINTASNYNLGLKSLLAFISNKTNKDVKKLAFAQIDVAFLKSYERWMDSRNRSKTTVGIYLRPLRAIFKSAIAAGDIPVELYPFGKGKYEIPAGRNIKKALDKDTLRTLRDFETDDVYMNKARDFWFFSYLCNGMNVRDIAELKYSNLQKDFIIFSRAKTRNTTRTDLKQIKVPITGYVTALIEKHGSKPAAADSYLFDVLKPGMTAKERAKTVNVFTRFINQHIKRLAKAAGIDENISSYWARHSFTTVAIQSGAPMEFIQESLGHQNLQTTMNYWAGFTESVKRDVAEKLMDF